MTTVRQWQVWGLPRPLQVVLMLQASAAVGLSVGVLPRATLEAPPMWGLLCLLAACGYLSERWAFRLGEAFALGSTGSGGVSVHSKAIWVFAGVVTLPVAYVMALAVFLTLADDLRVRRHRPADNPFHPHRIIFNVGLTATATFVGATVYAMLASAAPMPGMLLLASVAAWTAMYLLSQSILGVVLMFARGRPYRYPVEVLGSACWQWLGMAAQGCLLALAWQQDPLLILMGVPPVILLQQALLHRQMQEAAARDSKTGLLSAGRWTEMAEAALTGCQRRSQPLGVLVVDLDHFKRVNDTYGHLVGDDVLVAVADVMRGSVREADLVGRFGGEEFVVALPSAGPEIVAELAERLRRAIAGLAIPLEGRVQPLRVTASVGAASYPDDAFGMHDLLEQADRALYVAKHAGRNQVRFRADEAAPDTIPSSAGLLLRAAPPQEPAAT